MKCEQSPLEKNEIEVIYAAKRTVLTRWPVFTEGNFPMALDEANHRLLLGVWKPPQLLGLRYANRDATRSRRELVRSYLGRL
jgi:hypothetical protein